MIFGAIRSRYSSSILVRRGGTSNASSILFFTSPFDNSRVDVAPAPRFRNRCVSNVRSARFCSLTGKYVKIAIASATCALAKVRKLGLLSRLTSAHSLSGK